MNTTRNEKVEIKFAPTSGGWAWIVSALVDGKEVVSLWAPDKKAGRRDIKGRLALAGYVIAKPALKATAKVIPLPTLTAEAHRHTPTCSAGPHQHWTAHTLACRSNRDLVNVQRQAVR